MTLIETAIKLQARLQAANQEDDNDELLSRGRKVRDEIATAADYLEAVIAFRNTIGRSDVVAVKETELYRAIRRFRKALSEDTKALQQQYAVTVLNDCRLFIKQLARWVKSVWREQLAVAIRLTESTDHHGLHGSTKDVRRAEQIKARLANAILLDPINDRKELESLLNAQGLVSCLDRVDELIEEHRTVIRIIEDKATVMSPQVREALRSAKTYGIPLGEVTPELLTALESADVIDRLVVVYRS